MINRAIVAKTFRESAMPLLLCTAGLVLFEMAVIYAVDFRWKNIAGQMRQVPKFIQDVIEQMAGEGTLRNMTPTGLMALGFSHPLVQMIMWSYLVALTTRVIAGEIDRGTADVLFGLPVRRSTLYGSFTLVWVVSGLVLIGALMAGTLLGQRVFNKGDFLMERLWIVLANLYALYLAIGGLSFLISAASSRRGRAIGIMASFLVFSFIVDFIGELWPLVKSIAFVGALNYYRPLGITANGQWPVNNIMTLCGFSLACWLCGWVVLCRRDIRT